MSKIYSPKELVIKRRLSNRRWKKRNWDKVLYRDKLRRKRYGDVYYLYNLFWRLAFPEKVKQAVENWKKRNYEYALQCHRDWSKRNAAKTCSQANKRRQKSICELSKLEKIKIESIYWRAKWWREMGFDVVVDHILPIAKGGKHHPDNLQIIYQHENAQKWAHTNSSPSVIFL